jgi:hypothetical protein
MHGVSQGYSRRAITRNEIQSTATSQLWLAATIMVRVPICALEVDKAVPRSQFVSGLRQHMRRPISSENAWQKPQSPQP